MTFTINCITNGKIYQTKYIFTDEIKIPTFSYSSFIDMIVNYSSSIFYNSSAKSIAIPKGPDFKNYLCNSIVPDIIVPKNLYITYFWQFIPYWNQYSSWFPGNFWLFLLKIVISYALYPYIIRCVNSLILSRPVENKSHYNKINLTNLYNIYLNRFSTIVISILIFIRPALSQLYSNGLSLSHFYRIVASILTLFYIFLGTVFDYFSIRIHLRKTMPLNWLNYLLCGLIYYFNIILGIFFTNSIWFLIHPALNNLTSTLVFIPLSALFSSIWFRLRRITNISSYDLINSVFRQLVETVAFVSICINTYGSWNLLINNVNNLHTAYYISGSIGFFFHLISGYYLVELEFGSGNFILYGFLYWFWWSCAIFNTNAIIGLFIETFPYEDNFYTWIVLIFITFLSVVINFPNLYLHYIPNIDNTGTGTVITNSSLYDRIVNILTRNIFVIVIRLYLCIFSYCISGGLFWSIIMNYFI